MNNFSLSSPNGKHEYRPQLSPLHIAISNFPPASTKIQCDYDLLKAKVAHLENERVNLSIQIQKQFENDRSTKIQIQTLDNDLKDRDNAVKNLTRSLEEMQGDAKNLKEGKEVQFATIVSLNGRIDLQTKAAIETENLWSKMTNAKREIKRLEEEVVQTKHKEMVIETEKEDLRKEMVNLQEIIQTKQKEMTILRLEIEVKCLAFKDEKSILENENANLENAKIDISSKLASLISINEELNANIARDMEHFLKQQTVFLEEIKVLKQQNNNISTPSHLDTDGNNSNNNSQYNLVIKDLRNKLLQNEIKRKQLHNNLQEIRGNM
jgi:chromosome segregation ATPase